MYIGRFSSYVIQLVFSLIYKQKLDQSITCDPYVIRFFDIYKSSFLILYTIFHQTNQLQQIQYKPLLEKRSILIKDTEYKQKKCKHLDFMNPLSTIIHYMYNQIDFIELLALFYCEIKYYIATMCKNDPNKIDAFYNLLKLQYKQVIYSMNDISKAHKDFIYTCMSYVVKKL
jgi:hypothetical protein